MKIIFKTLPSNWVYQLVTLSLITASSFYLLQFTDDVNVVREFWSMNEKFYIYTFLGIQFAVKAFFYWLLFLLLKRFLFERIKNRILGEINRHKSFEDLKAISELKQILIQIFGIPLELGLMNKEDLTDKIEMTETELDEVMKTNIQWICVLIHLSLIAMLIWHLSAFYIVPLLVVVFILILGYCYLITFLFANIRLIERVRVELIKSPITPIK